MDNSIFTHIFTSNVLRDTILVSKPRFSGVKESIYYVVKGLNTTEISDFYIRPLNFDTRMLLNFKSLSCVIF